MNKRIMIVEDEGLVALALKERLMGMGYEVPAVAAHADEAVRQALAVNPDLILMDIMLAGESSGIQAAEAIHKKQDTPVIYLTAYADEATVSQATLTAPYAYLLKPYDDRELRSSIEITLYKSQLERRVIENQRLLSTTLHSIGDAVITTDPAGLVTYLNPAAEGVTGWSNAEAMGQPIQMIFKVTDEDRPGQALDPVGDALRTGRLVSLEGRFQLTTRKGLMKPVDDSAAPIRDEFGRVYGAVLVFRDVTQIRLAEAQIVASLHEKEVLLQEIHHRVKNNLQVISSMLTLQTSQVKEPVVQQLVRESQQRIHSMALIHDKLYRSSSLVHINLAEYTRDLATYLINSQRAPALKVDVQINAQPIYASTDLATPYGLILNELLSNVFKHAFIGRKVARVNIELRALPDKHLELVVADDGVGMPADWEANQSKTLGLRLLAKLTSQIQGSFKLESEGGVKVTVTAPLD